MLLFRSEEEVRTWCQEHDRPSGAIIGLAQLRQLATAWYGDRLQPAWRPRTPAESQAVLRGVGLDGDFWQLT